MYNYFSLLLAMLVISLWSCQTPTKIDHSIAKWQKLTLSFEGPQTSESASPNPFTDYRMMVRFRLGERSVVIPGFYAADGNSAETSADSGNVWQVRFRPDEVGLWTYEVSFREAANIATSDDPEAGTAGYCDGQSGTIEVTAAPSGEEGRLLRTDARYLQYAESGRYFIKGGAGSPENFLGYADFDGTYKGRAPEEREGEATAKEELHRYEPHFQDWKEGDPSWHGDKGKTMIGMLNYLASKNNNTVYFLTLNIEGDGKDVWPYTGYDERSRFDCSKLAQWEMVFDHMDDLGLMLHIITQETENERLLDDGDTGPQRKLYYRELIARY
ncbi:MAG: DUF5060 domain-containing protein, partial [Bacteroidota bacterium]